MDQQRGRSPSAGHQQPHINPSHSPSPHQFQENTNSIGLGLGLDSSSQGNNQQYMTTGGFNSNTTLPSYNDNNQFLNQQGQSFSQSGLDEPMYIPSSDFNQQQFVKQEDQSVTFGQQGSFTRELLDPNLPTNFNGDFPLFSGPNNPADQYDPSFLFNQLPSQSSDQSVNPANLDMASPQSHADTPPGLLLPDHLSPGSAHQSPNFNQNQFQSSPGHSRNASLGPESAAFPQGTDWSMMPPQFTGHRRTPSEYSDVSASSAQHSPNLGHHDTFESIENQHSPMQHPQDPSLYQDLNSGIGSFSLSDPQIQHSASPRRGLSPAHSPAISPRLGPQPLPMMNQQNNFMLGMNNGFAPQQDMYNGQESFPTLGNDMGQGQQMVPDINVEFAPNSRQNSFEPPKPSLDQAALTPPDRGT